MNVDIALALLCLNVCSLLIGTKAIAENLSVGPALLKCDAARVAGVVSHLER